jgi:hypothetical protein
LSWLAEWRANLDSPGVVVGNEFLGGPLAILEPGLIDLEKAQVLSSSLRGVVDLGEVVEHGTNVRHGPGVPLDVETASSGHFGNFGTGSRIFMTADLKMKLEKCSNEFESLIMSK